MFNINAPAFLIRRKNALNDKRIMDSIPSNSYSTEGKVSRVKERGSTAKADYASQSVGARGTEKRGQLHKGTLYKWYVRAPEGHLVSGSQAAGLSPSLSNPLLVCSFSP
jgi:hypothetical protein